MGIPSVSFDTEGVQSWSTMVMRLVPVSPNPEESLLPQALAAACLCPIANTTNLPTTMEGPCVWRVYKRQ